MNVSRETRHDEATELGALAGVDVSRETLSRLRLYVDLLRRWNSRINLVSKADDALLWTRHVADSLQLAPLIPKDAKRGIDLGSGAGFPGIILAMTTNIPFELIEADARKAAFLREAARVCGAPVGVTVARIENAAVKQADIVTARALAPLPALLALAARFIAPGGVALFPKGATAAKELTDAQAMWNMRAERHPSRVDPQGCILRISEVSRV